MSTWELLCKIVFLQCGVGSVLLGHAPSVLYAGGKEEAGFVFFLKGFKKGYMFWWGRILLSPKEVAHACGFFLTSGAVAASTEFSMTACVMEV